MRQVARIVMAGGSSSPDEQNASPDEGGGYGELVEDIDRVAGQVKPSEQAPSDP